MTVNQANDLVRGLIGEDDYHHAEKMLLGFYDIAQRQIATTVSPIRASFEVPENQTVTLPPDMYRLASVSGEYSKTGKNRITAGRGGATVSYYAYPAPLSANTPGDYEFELEAQAQIALPYFAAAYAVLSDSDMRRYYAFMDMYNNILSNIVSANDSTAKITVVRTEDM